MAYHFSANQFNDQYSPRKLGNWEYPKWYPERPRQRFKSTKIIADDNGRLLDGIKRGGNAWGNYVGTWDLPRRITREYVKKLVAPDERLIKLWSQKKKKAEEVTQEPASSEKKEEKEGTCKICNRLLSECICKTCQKPSKTKSRKSLKSDEVEIGEKFYPCPACKGDQWVCDGHIKRSSGG